MATERVSCVNCGDTQPCNDCRFENDGELWCSYCGLIYLALYRDDPCECIDGDLHLEIQLPKSTTMRKVATEPCERCLEKNAAFDYPVGNSTVRVCSPCWTVLNGRPWRVDEIVYGENAKAPTSGADAS